MFIEKVLQMPFWNTIMIYIAIETLESKIQWCAFLKIFVLILIAVAQVYILTGYFKNRKEFAV
jgi:hypothetical protein